MSSLLRFLSVIFSVMSKLVARIDRRLRDVPESAVGHVYVSTRSLLTHFPLVV